MMDSTGIGALVKELRKAAGMSQMQLADKIGVTYQQVQKYEKGISKFNVPRLMQYAEVFGVSVSFLLKGAQTSKVAEERESYTGVPLEEAEVLMLFRRLRLKSRRDSLLSLVGNVVKLSESLPAK
jgi:transcriptional regulator with XRE-family HTH domain